MENAVCRNINWGFTVVANIFEEHKPPFAGFQYCVLFNNYPDLNAKAASSSKMSQTIYQLTS
jgi:hypothetical protein